GVGRGKTYMMDVFFHSLPFENKARMHFHRFMQRVHAELRQHEGKKNPLELVADSLASETKVLCFDEFFVSDITDAMILANLLEALFARGITLVATSNIEPENLYRNGLQRARFLPAIGLILQHCQVVNIDSGIDYRLRKLSQAGIFHFPLDAGAEKNLHQYFEHFADSSSVQETEITINNRQIKVEKEAQGVLFIAFSHLCESARSQFDYIEIAKLYHTVLLSDVRQMGAESDDAARRFIAMVDEFYERKVKLIISSEVSMEELYSTGRLTFEFERCCSRLKEMQSHEYLSLPHLP
ncbi:MAG: cell division protein ZapE, partial [Flavobacteriales bacterium]|nr:cell division protein ZapE [Flavobacteriales bacterium]